MEVFKMETRMEKAIEKRNRGYNCAQAVACSYCDVIGVDEKTVFRACEGLGTGMGNMEGTCGAVSGACVLMGFLSSTANLDVPNSKGRTLSLSKIIIDKFKERNGCTICRDLKGIETGTVIRSCPDCIRDACEFTEEIFSNIAGK